MKQSAAFILLILTAFSCARPPSVKEESFGILSDGREAHIFTLENASGAYVRLSDYGARIVGICVPDKKGRLLDVVTGPGDLRTFEEGDRFMGCIVGRYGNRIDGAEFSLDGAQYVLDANEFFDGAPVHIHGGRDGFDRKLWRAAPLSEPGRSGVRMEYLSPDGEMGYPGNLHTSVTYWWTDDNVLRIAYEAKTDKPTVVNLSNHTYFNLGGQDRYVMEQLLQVDADQYIQNNTHFCPDLVLPVDDSPFDFREPHRVDYRIDRPNAHLTIMHGMSACWAVKDYDGTLRKACRLYSRQSGIALSCWTTEPFLLTYTARGFDGSIPGKYGPLEKFSGMLLETTHAADSPNQNRFPSAILRPGETYISVTEFRFCRE